MYLNQPFVRFLLPLVAGIITHVFLNARHWLPANHLAAILIAMVLVGILGMVKNRSTPILQTYGLLFCLGFLVTDLKNKVFIGEVAALEGNEYDACILEIKSLGEKKKATIRYETHLKYIRTGGHWQKTGAKVLLSAPQTGGDIPLGTFVLVRDRLLIRPSLPLNPGEFDYRQYLERKGIAWTVFVPQGSYALLPARHAVPASLWPLQLARRADSLLQVSLKSPLSYGLLKAMLLGRRDELGADLLDSYVSAGAVHVLAVSGLHVGVLFILLSRLLGWLRKSAAGRYLYLLLIVLILAFYAIITGLSPSVIRASLMCVTFALSQTFARKHNGLNTLALSAFIILLFDPLALFFVGFQLSYAAVLGIVLFYPLLKNSYETKVPAFRWLWQITLVSFSAQIFTFPISVYYFHQFPAYFWLVNPVVIGLTSVLIYSALGLLLVGASGLFTPLFLLLAYWTDGLASAMNRVVQFPGQLPGYLFEGLHLDGLEVMFLLGWMLVVYKVVKEREKKYLKAVFLGSLLFFTYGVGKSLYQFNTASLVLHAVPKHTVLSLTKGRQAHIIADQAFKADTFAYDFRLKNYLIAQGTPIVELHDLPDNASSRPMRMNVSDRSIYFDARPDDRMGGWVVIRRRQYPRTDSVPDSRAAAFLLSPELGFKTRERWKFLLERAGNRVIDPTGEGAHLWP